MALVVCPECGREKISDKAVACPDCGFPIAEHFKESSNGDNTEIDTKKEREVREVTIGDVTYCYLSEYEELGKVRDFVADASNDATRELIKKYYENAEVKGLAVFDGCLVNLIKDGWLSVTDKCVAFLMKNGIDDIDRKELRSITRERPQYKNYMLEYKRLLNGDVKQVKDEIEKIHLKRSGERSNRSEWRAMGFGVKNAIVASVKASILNAIQSSIRSVGDNLIDASDRNRIDSMTENLLYDEKLIKLLAKIFFGECFNYYYALEYILSQHGIISSYDYSKHSEFEKNERILNNYYRNIDEIDDVDEKIDAVMKTMFESDPFNVVNYGNMLYHNIEDYDKIFKLADSFGVGYELFYSDELENTVFSLCEDLYEEAKETNYSDEDDLEFFKEDVQILKRAFNYLVVRDDLFGINTFWLNVIIPKLEKMDFSFFENKKESDDENEAKNDETLLVGNDIEAEDNSNTEIKDNSSDSLYSADNLDSKKEKVKDICIQYESEHKDDYGITDKIKRGLSIPSEENVWLVHDDTLFKNGKNGFAITEKGFYCCEMWEKPIFIPFSEVVNVDTLNWGEKGKERIMADQRALTYYMSNDNADSLMELYKSILSILNN